MRGPAGVARVSVAGTVAVESGVRQRMWGLRWFARVIDQAPLLSTLAGCAGVGFRRGRTEPGEQSTTRAFGLAPGETDTRDVWPVETQEASRERPQGRRDLPSRDRAVRGSSDATRFVRSESARSAGDRAARTRERRSPPRGGAAHIRDADEGRGRAASAAGASRRRIAASTRWASGALPGRSAGGGFGQAGTGPRRARKAQGHRAARTPDARTPRARADGVGEAGSLGDETTTHDAGVGSDRTSRGGRFQRVSPWLRRHLDDGETGDGRSLGDLARDIRRLRLELAR